MSAPAVPQLLTLLAIRIQPDEVGCSSGPGIPPELLEAAAPGAAGEVRRCRATLTWRTSCFPTAAR